MQIFMMLELKKKKKKKGACGFSVSLLLFSFEELEM